MAVIAAIRPPRTVAALDKCAVLARPGLRAMPTIGLIMIPLVYSIVRCCFRVALLRVRLIVCPKLTGFQRSCFLLLLLSLLLLWRIS